MRKSLIIGVPILIVIITIGYFVFFHTRSTPTTHVVISVGTGNLSETVKATGKISPVQDSVLSFAKQGTITRINKNIGDSVQAGDIIAEIDSSSPNLDIENAKVSLSNAENNYNKLIGNTNNTDKIRAENTLADAEARLTLMETNLDNAILSNQNAEKNAADNIASLESQVVIAQNDYDYTKGSQNSSSSTDTNNLERDMTSAFLLLQNISRTLDALNSQIRDTLMMDSRSSASYGDLGANNALLKLDMERAYSGALEDFARYNTSLSDLQNMNPRSFDAIMTRLNTANILLSQYDSLISTALRVVDASPLTNALPQSMQDAMKTSLRSYATQIENSLSNVNSSLTNLKGYGNEDLQALQDKNTLLQKQSALTNAENNLSKARTSLEELKRSNAASLLQSQQDIESQKNTIKLSRSSLEDLTNPNSTDVAAARNSVRSAQINLDKAYIALADYQIKAPYDGKILDIPWKIGTTTLSTDAVTMANDSAFEVDILLDQIDIVKVQPGMSAEVQFDAFPDLTLTGTISSVSGAPIESSSVVSYTAKILLPPIPDKQIFSDMTATVSIIVAERNDVIVVPSSAVRTTGDQSIVNVEKSDGTTERRPVKTGLVSNGRTEITSGLSLGEKIIVGTTSANSPARTGTGSNTNIFGGGGGVIMGGGMGGGIGGGNRGGFGG